jgi:hypothetical protein
MGPLHLNHAIWLARGDALGAFLLRKLRAGVGQLRGTRRRVRKRP